MDCISWWCITSAGNESSSNKRLHSSYTKEGYKEKDHQGHGQFYWQLKTVKLTFTTQAGAKREQNELKFPFGLEIWAHPGISPFLLPHLPKKSDESQCLYEISFLPCGIQEKYLRNIRMKSFVKRILVERSPTTVQLARPQSISPSNHPRYSTD